MFRDVDKVHFLRAIEALRTAQYYCNETLKAYKSRSCQSVFRNYVETSEFLSIAYDRIESISDLSEFSKMNKFKNFEKQAKKIDDKLEKLSNKFANKCIKD